MSGEPISYEIEPKIPPSYVEKLYEFIYHKLLLAQKNRFTDISNKMDSGTFSLAYKVIDSSGKPELRVQITGNKPVNMLITPLVARISEQEFSKAKEDIDVAIDFFEEQMRTNTLFFAWREGESIFAFEMATSPAQSPFSFFLLKGYSFSFAKVSAIEPGVGFEPLPQWR
jgi:hypothetical protein